MLLQYAATVVPISGILATQAGGSGGPDSSSCRPHCAISAALSAIVAPTTMNGAIISNASSTTMTNADSPLRSRSRAVTRQYSGHVVVQRIAAHTSAVMNGCSTKKQPMISIARTTSVSD